MNSRGYFLGADWSRAGVYNGTLEDLSGNSPTTCYVEQGTDVVASWGRDQNGALADATVGTMSFALVNDQRQFSPENTLSPVAGKVLPGTPVTLAVTDPATGATTTVATGPIDTLDVDPNAAGKTFSATCSDGWGKPGDTQLSTPVYTGQRTGDLVNIILDAIGWPTAKRAIDPGATLVPYWWAEGQDAAGAVNDLVHSEGPPAIAYVQGGVFCFRDRHHRLLAARSRTSQGTYSHLLTPVPTTNQLTNSTFESGVTSWTAFNGATRAQSSTWARTGTFSMRITPDGVTGGPYVESEQHATPAGFQWSASAWWFNGVAWPAGVAVNLEWYDASHGYLSVTQGTAVPLPAGAPTQATVTGWPPTGAAYVSMNVSVTGTPGAGILFYVDDPSLAPVPDSKILRDSFGYNHGLANIINSATLEVAPRIPGDRQEVWSSEDPITLAASETVTVIARLDDPAMDLQTPVSGTDFSVAAGSVTAASLSRTSGQAVLITLTAGGGGAFLDGGIRLRGTPLRQGVARLFTSSDPSSENTFGANDWGGSAPWAYFYDAAVLVNRVVSVYGRARPQVTFDIDGVVSAAALTQILGQKISDRITVRNDEMGLNADFVVERLTHTVQQLGVRHRLTIGAEVVEPMQAANPFTFDVSGKGFNDGQFGMDGGNNPATMFMFDVAGKGFNGGLFAA